jgi:hypothetical protein
MGLKNLIGQQLHHDVVIFVDNLQVTGPTKSKTWQASQQAAASSNHLGIQDAPRKRRDGSQAPGVCSGCVLQTDQDGVFVHVSQEKGDKTKQLLEKVMDDEAADEMAQQELKDHQHAAGRSANARIPAPIATTKPNAMSTPPPTPTCKATASAVAIGSEIWGH